MRSFLSRVFGGGSGTSQEDRDGVARAEGYRALAVSIHDAVLDAGVLVKGLSVAVSCGVAVLCGTVADEQVRARALAAARSTAGQLHLDDCLDIGWVEYWLGPFSFDALPPAGAKRLRAWEESSQAFSELLVDHDEITWFLDEVASRANVRPLTSFGEDDGVSPGRAWHVAADALPTLDTLLAADKGQLVAAGTAQGMPELDFDAWRLLWQGLINAREALAVASTHGIRFEFHG